MPQVAPSAASPTSGADLAAGAPPSQADATTTGVPPPLSEAAPGSRPADPALRPADLLDTPSVDPAATREERIRQAAYERFLQRHGAPGDPVDDWLAAEAEISSDAR